MIGLERVRHVCLVTQRYADMVTFYRDVVGFRLKSESESSSAALSRGLGMDNAEVACALLTPPEQDFEVEIVQFKGDAKPVGHSPLDRPGYRHLALIVRDIDEAVGVLKSQGFPFVSEPVVVHRRDGVSVRFVYFRDPEGNYVELNQFT